MSNQKRNQQKRKGPRTSGCKKTQCIEFEENLRQQLSILYLRREQCSAKFVGKVKESLLALDLRRCLSEKEIDSLKRLEKTQNNSSNQ